MSKWKDVEFVMADGPIEKGQAANVGEGWCDCVIESADFGTVRFWAKSDGSVDLPMNPVRLTKPFDS
jgi:hypothetical protein